MSGRLETTVTQLTSRQCRLVESASKLFNTSSCKTLPTFNKNELKGHCKQIFGSVGKRVVFEINLLPHGAIHAQCFLGPIRPRVSHRREGKGKC